MDGTVHDPGMEGRVERLEIDMREVKATLGRLEPMIVSIHAQMPYLATKAEVEAVRGELKADIAVLRGEVKADIEGLRGEVKADIEGLRGETMAALAGKPGFAAMWTMAITLLALVVASMAAGAAYLPLIAHAFHAT